ncbi:MAG: signal peptidase I [Oscillospiraceae bacterium]|nr:signal peptidase I [Oscillospiraceae bacterium]
MSVLQQQFMQLIDACDINDSDNDLLALLGVPAQASAVVMPDDGLAFTLPALPQAKQKRQSKAVPWVALALMSVLCVVILGGAAMTALSANSARAVAGLRVFHVTSNSMAPTANSNGNVQSGWMRAGDAIIVRNVEPQHIAVGNVITVDRGTQQDPLTHRVMAILENFDDPSGLGFITQGDANRSPDPHVGGSQVMGVTALRIPLAGHVLGFVHENLAVSIGLSALVLLGFIPLFVILLNNGKKKNASESLAQNGAEGQI